MKTDPNRGMSAVWRHIRKCLQICDWIICTQFVSSIVLIDRWQGKGSNKLFNMQFDGKILLTGHIAPNLLAN